MLLQAVIVLLYIKIPLCLAQAPALLDALRSSGASDFAASIENDPFLLSLYNSTQVQTVFAPADDAPGSKSKRQETPAQEQSGGIQCSGGLNSVADNNKRPGAQIPTKDTRANLGGKPQSVVSDSRRSSSSGASKRDVSLLLRDTTSPSNTSNSSLPSIFSGLGNSVNIVKGDVAYNGGLIHIVDG